MLTEGEKIESRIEGKKIEDITEEELDALYVYLSFHFEDMPNEDKLFWIDLLKKLDDEFDDTSDY
jgi:hypothetical protein